jgi:feruloyl-CoA synthase
MASHTPFAPLDLEPPDVRLENRPDGSILLRARQPLRAYPAHLGAILQARAEQTGDRVFLGERLGSGWRELTYGDAWIQAQRIGQALLDRGFGPNRPIVLLSGNSIDHARLTLGAIVVGIPVVPVSPAYSLRSTDFAKIRHVDQLVQPGMVFADDPAAYAGALANIRTDAERIAEVDALARTPVTAAVDAAFAAIRAQDVAKILLTSGSTGVPKGVLNTHEMLCSNQQMIAQSWPFLGQTPPVLLDWLPWNHTFGGNHNFNLVLYSGGTLYIDDGRPMPGAIERTVENLRLVSPTLYFNVPAGFATLLPFLEADSALADGFFRHLQLIFYAGAALPPDLWRRLERLSERHLGYRVHMVSAWGSTETAPMATLVHFPIDRAGVIGVPAPGVTIKLVPDGDQLELRVRGPNVTPGYLNDAARTEAAFDAEGFYRSGDAGQLLDPDNPSAGLVFAGRTAEDFKLTTGTWVRVGALRLAILEAAAPLLSDIVIAGHDRPAIGLLAWPSPEAADMHPATLQAQLTDRLVQHNTIAPTSTRIERLLLLQAAPSIDANEITDKGYINQRAVLRHRADEVQRLFDTEPDDAVCCPSLDPEATHRPSATTS